MNGFIQKVCAVACVALASAVIGSVMAPCLIVGVAAALTTIGGGCYA